VPFAAARRRTGTHHLIEGAGFLSGLEGTDQAVAATADQLAPFPQKELVQFGIIGEDSALTVEDHDAVARSLENGVDLIPRQGQLCVRLPQIFENPHEGGTDDPDGIEAQKHLVIQLLGAQGHRAHHPQQLIDLVADITDAPRLPVAQTGIFFPQPGDLHLDAWTCGCVNIVHACCSLTITIV